MLFLLVKSWDETDPKISKSVHHFQELVTPRVGILGDHSAIIITMGKGTTDNRQHTASSQLS